MTLPTDALAFIPPARELRHDGLEALALVSGKWLSIRWCVSIKAWEIASKPNHYLIREPNRFKRMLP